MISEENPQLSSQLLFSRAADRVRVLNTGRSHIHESESKS